MDTGATDADERLRTLEPELHEGLLRLSRRVRGNPASVAIIEHQFSMKNTMGYGINSLLDFERPAEILAHLIVGSEGTLGFVADAVFRTIPLLTHVTTGLLVFADLEAANTALPALVETGAATLELMDALSLQVGQALPATPPAMAIKGTLAASAVLSTSPRIWRSFASIPAPLIRPFEPDRRSLIPCPFAGRRPGPPRPLPARRRSPTGPRVWVVGRSSWQTYGWVGRRAGEHLFPLGFKP